MSRESYSEDGDERDFALWRGRLASSKRSRRGRAALRELREALLALPQKRLVAGRLAVDGEVCTVGALVLYRKAKELGSVDAAQAELEMLDSWCTCQHRAGDHDENGRCGLCRRLAARRRLECEYGMWPQRRFIPEWPTLRPWSEVLWEPRPVSETRYSRCEGFTTWMPDAEEHDLDSSVTIALAKEAGVPDTVAWWLVAQNDDVDHGYGDFEPEQRYEAVLRDVEDDLRRMGELQA